MREELIFWFPTDVLDEKLTSLILPTWEIGKRYSTFLSQESWLRFSETWFSLFFVFQIKLFELRIAFSPGQEKACSLPWGLSDLANKIAGSSSDLWISDKQWTIFFSIAMQYTELAFICIYRDISVYLMQLGYTLTLNKQF